MTHSIELNVQNSLISLYLLMLPAQLQRFSGGYPTLSSLDLKTDKVLQVILIIMWMSMMTVLVIHVSDSAVVKLKEVIPLEFN